MSEEAKKRSQDAKKTLLKILTSPEEMEKYIAKVESRRKPAPVQVARIREQLAKLVKGQVETKIMKHIQEDLILPSLSEHAKVEVSLENDDGVVCICYGQRDWAFEADTGEWIGQGTNLLESTI
jgi:F0F1-type ATP synthase membrane subunit b/b'